MVENDAYHERMADRKSLWVDGGTMPNFFHTAMRNAGVVLAFIFAFLAGSFIARAAPIPTENFTLQTVADIPLHGHATRFDYQSYDEGRHLLFIAHLGDSSVTVFDTRTRKVVADIAGVSEVHGVLAIPALRRVYASATGRNEVVAINETTLKVVAAIPGGNYPDGMAYVPPAHKLYVSDETGGTETVIDVRSNQRVATIPLGGEAGNTQYDPASGHIFVNVQTRGDLVEIDPATDQIVARHRLPGANHNHGLLIEPGGKLAFIACEGNSKLLVLDMQSKRVVATEPVGNTPDVLAFDPGPSVHYVASESGVIAVFQVKGNAVRKLWEAHVATKAHTVAVDPGAHYVYLPLENVDGKPLLRIMQPAF
jgi:YVTN family beta-propeller protein